MNLLADLTSKDPQRIWASACAVRKLRDTQELAHLAEHLDEIERSTNHVPLGGAIRPNSSHLEFALRKLEYVKKGSGCLCALYPFNDLYNPQEEEQEGNVKIRSATSNAEAWTSAYECECCFCHANYHVEEGQYHYTWWTWTRV